MKITGSKYNKNGQEYVKADNMDLNIKIPKIKFHFDNLFNGDKALGDLGNTLVNQNTDLFVPDIEAAVKQTLGKLNNFVSVSKTISK